MNLLSSGSAKDLFTLDEHPEHLAFRFSERISVFDYGVIPDLIPHRSTALRRSALAFEKVFAQNSILTLFDAELTQEIGEMVQIKAFHPKHMLAQDQNTDWEFIPLEIIFRWGAPAGSSYLKRFPNVKPFEEFANPKIEFSTKLEATDRMLTDDQAKELLQDGVSFTGLREVARHVAEVLKVYLNNLGLDLWDGKIECAYNRKDGRIALVDAMTPDELRVSLPGLRNVSLSKELLRQWLGPTLWGFDVSFCKKEFGAEWKDHCPPPPSLGDWRVQKLSQLYLAFAECLENKSAEPLMSWVRKDSDKPKVYVSGSGGREAAVKWRLEREGCEIVDDEALADAIFLTQDADMARGLADDMRVRRCWVYGASRKASEIEWSKKYGRKIAELAGIAVPRHTTDVTQLETFSPAPVVKFDGLAAGKGVVVARDITEARMAIDKFTPDGEVLLEERLEGVEASVFFGVRSGVSGIDCTYLGSARDFKRRYAGDAGPNTGGMGAHVPHPLESAAEIELWRKWALATVQVLADKGRPYNGVLYLGLMKDKTKGWNLIEYNARPGDPETQALVKLWPESQTVLRSQLAVSIYPIRDQEITQDRVVALALVNPDYPETPRADVKLKAWEPKANSEIQLFQTASLKGRVAYLVARGKNIQEAGDKIFGSLVESPWKDVLEWRPDILE